DHGDRVATRTTAAGVITGNVSGLVVAWRYMRIDPVMVAVPRQVHDVGEDLLSAADAVPKQFEDAARHTRMAHDVVRLADDVRIRVAGDVKEQPVGIGDGSACVGLADDHSIVGKETLNAGGGNGRSRHGASLGM